MTRLMAAAGSSLQLKLPKGCDMWPFKRKKVRADVEVIEPNTIGLTLLVNSELKNLANQNLSIKTKCMVIHNMLRRYRELGYEIDIKR